jgi:DNA (cytosine-5)-methyltransferase 1
MLHIDLFSGIGGFAYAIDQVYGKTKHIFVENDPFCTAVLKKHWPEAEYYGDIRAFTYAEDKGLEGSGEIKNGEHDRRSDRVDFLTGGFPCQPFSQAGVRKGTSDDRYLWPEMLRVIREAKPRWVIAENVRGILTIQNGLVFEQVCLDLEGAGYEVRAFIIPAVAVGAPHRRDRVWFIANNKGGNVQGEYKQPQREREFRRQACGNTYNPISERLEREKHEKSATATEPDRNTPNTEGGRPWEQTEQERGQDISGRNSNASNTRQQYGEQGNSQELATNKTQRATRPTDNERQSEVDWSRNWKEVALATCYDRVDDGLPRRMDGTTISGARHRKERLKACGNAIVPQVAMKILKAIKDAN